MDKNSLRIIYMGTPDFAVEPLRKLIDGKYNIVAVITNPDKPAGRGQKIQESAVKVYAKTQDINVLQPEKFRDEIFLNQLKELNADLQIVVAFKMLPEIVWNMPRLGTFNLHASLLPQYRGAAPINWAVINGDEKTGVTTFFLKHKIDTGNVIFQEEISINQNDNAGTIHDKLMFKGADVVVKTVDAIICNDYKQIDQNDLISEDDEIRHAPKIFKNDCKIEWEKELESIYNLIRGLSPYPAAWTEITNIKNEKLQLKIFAAEIEKTTHKNEFGKYISDNKTFLKVAANCGYINIIELQLSGKKKMSVVDFLKGFRLRT